MTDLDRRRFLEFLGRSTAGLAYVAGAGGAAGLLSACATASRSGGFGRSPIPGDDLELVDGLQYRVVLGWRDEIAPGLAFGDCNDFLAFTPKAGAPDEAYLWSNHEYFSSMFVSGRTKIKGERRDPVEVKREQREVGGSIVLMRRDRGEWKPVVGAPENRRFDALTDIPFAGGQSIRGSRKARGTLGNCAGGVTPWGTVLSCEENYEEFLGERVYENGQPREVSTAGCLYGWESVLSSDEYPPEHFGWVVEIDPATGKSQKLTSLGRFAHESAAVIPGADGRCVVYLGDDGNDRCLYKFIADRPGTLEHGTLYTANIEEGRWIPLALGRKDTHPLLAKNFRTPLDLLTRARLASYLVGGTLLDRPEGIARDPLAGGVYVALTNNIGAGRPHGSILKIEEDGNDPRATRFRASTFLPGGPQAGFSCPDNLMFDPAGNLWMVSDVSGSSMGKAPYAEFPRNGLFVIPTRGPQAGQPQRLGLAPWDAELTGPCFAPGGKELFLSVQHPGETTTDPSAPTSRWPFGGAKPRSCVIAISGPRLAEILARS